MAENYLITGYWGEPHVTAENDRGINAATFGGGRYVLPVGQRFRAEYIGNNTVRMYDGKLMNGGAAAGIPAGRYIDLLISEAGQGMNRNDLIVFQYEKNASSLVESGIFTVVRGTETTGTAEDPALRQADLLSDEATFDQMALWRVPVSSAVISAPVKLFEVSKNIRSACNTVAVASSDNGVNYTADVEGVEELYNGLSFTIIPSVGSASTAPTLNVNGLGAKTIRRRISGNMSLTVAGSRADWLAKNRPITLTYNGTYWLVDNIMPNANDIYGVLPIENGGTGATTASEALAALGCMGLFDVSDGNTDMDSVLTSGRHAAFYRTSNQTKGTPYDKGATTFHNALILSFGGNNYGTQLALVSGSARLFIRSSSYGTVGDWTVI